MDEYMVVDGYNGLKIVKCNPKNFYSSNWAVQFVGDKPACEQEMQRLKVFEREWAAKNNQK
jgi:hypothetical protein